ncbi:O-methylsterigmatocystin oxidoreductase Short=OMST oxidoreductase [Rhizoctonia solani AG-1 IB]|uniref:O-methylsterigmatocystin oxidoreductase Short=OMST oxidoreductase n=1 Tax=Thanatephorus cucumeris (strain AG1-IB / isolate 7/3/14) TaxID=1108050 RepID=M5CAE5_THACB|nr:O-methylsterigmatocystin oxidoreductase Short=OMST oxidoreductase [Rhizoctonia solani AG-1 IB]
MTDLQDRQSEIARVVGAVVLQSAYGYEATKPDDPMVEIARAGMKGFSDASNPADFLVNVFPWLEYVPSWFPGAGWKRKAMAWNKVGEDLINVPFEWTKQQMVNGTAQPSALSSILTKVTNIQSEGDRAEEEDRIKWAIGSFYGGAIETTTATILIFILAMVHYPDIQAKIQQEVDTVVGDQRLPEMDDQDNLPYIARVIKETMTLHE